MNGMEKRIAAIVAAYKVAWRLHGGETRGMRVSRQTLCLMLGFEVWFDKFHEEFIAH